MLQKVSVKGFRERKHTMASCSSIIYFIPDVGLYLSYRPSAVETHALFRHDFRIVPETDTTLGTRPPTCLTRMTMSCVLVHNVQNMEGPDG